MHTQNYEILPVVGLMYVFAPISSKSLPRDRCSRFFLYHLWSNKVIGDMRWTVIIIYSYLLLSKQHFHSVCKRSAIGKELAPRFRSIGFNPRLRPKTFFISWAHLYCHNEIIIFKLNSNKNYIQVSKQWFSSNIARNRLIVY